MTGSARVDERTCRPRVLWWLVIAAALTAGNAHAQFPAPGGQVLVPGSSIAKPGDAGERAHTNTLIFIPDRGAAAARPAPGVAGRTPSPAAPGKRKVNGTPSAQ